MAVDHERRSQTRIRPKGTILVDYPEYQPQVRDISLSGAYIEDARPRFTRGRLFQLRLWLDKQTSIEVKAMVRRVEEQKGMGVEFLGISEQDLIRLREIVGASSRPESLPSY